MFDRILVPVDGSEHAKQALVIACRLLNMTDAKLHLLHVPQALGYETTLVWGVGSIHAETTLADREKAGEKLLKQAAAFASEQGVEQIEKQLTQGDTVRVILASADNIPVDAIVMGSRGLGNLGGMVIGSVSHAVSHAAKCRVITVS